MFIGENLRNLRLLHYYSQSSLAEEIGVSERDIWCYENGFKQPSFEHVNIFKALFNVKSTYFYRSDLLNGTINNVNVDHISFRFLHD